MPQPAMQVRIEGHPEASCNGVYDRFAVWNGQPAYRTRDEPHRFLYYYDKNEGGARSWSIDNRDQSDQPVPGGRDWCEDGWTSMARMTAC